jgi:hypothetical protein
MEYEFVHDQILLKEVALVFSIMVVISTAKSAEE